MMQVAGHNITADRTTMGSIKVKELFPLALLRYQIQAGLILCNFFCTVLF